MVYIENNAKIGDGYFGQKQLVIWWFGSQKLGDLVILSKFRDGDLVILSKCGDGELPQNVWWFCDFGNKKLVILAI